MSFGQLVFGFQGRIRRSQWWAVRLALFGVVMVALMMIGVIGTAFEHNGKLDDGFALVIGSLFLASLPFFAWVGLAANVKRLHDQDLSGWLTLLVFIPLIGAFFSLICMGILDGTPGRNRFGPSPKHPDSPTKVFDEPDQAVV